MPALVAVPDGAFRRYEAPTIILSVHGGAVILTLDGVRLLEQARRTVVAERIETLRSAIDEGGDDGELAAADALRDITALNAFWGDRPHGGRGSLEKAAEDAADGKPVIVSRFHAADLLAHAADHPHLAAIVAAFNDTQKETTR